MSDQTQQSAQAQSKQQEPQEQQEQPNQQMPRRRKPICKFCLLGQCSQNDRRYWHLPSHVLPLNQQTAKEIYTKLTVEQDILTHPTIHQPQTVRAQSPRKYGQSYDNVGSTGSSQQNFRQYGNGGNGGSSGQSQQNFRQSGRNHYRQVSPRQQTQQTQQSAPRSTEQSAPRSTEQSEPRSTEQPTQQEKSESAGSSKSPKIELLD
jgi:hypothetical protein